MSKYSIIFRTQVGPTATDDVLFKTDRPALAAGIRLAIERVAGERHDRAPTRRIKIGAINYDRLRVFYPESTMPGRSSPWPVKCGQEFSSTGAFAHAIKAHPTTVRMALVKARRAKKSHATVYGISFAYVKSTRR